MLSIPGPSLPAPTPLVAPSLGTGFGGNSGFSFNGNTGIGGKSQLTLGAIQPPNLSLGTNAFGSKFGGLSEGGMKKSSMKTSFEPSVRPVVSSTVGSTVKTVRILDEGSSEAAMTSVDGAVRVIRSSSPSTQPVMGYATSSVGPSPTNATRSINAPRNLAALAQEQLQTIEAAVRAGRSEADNLELKDHAKFWQTAHEIQKARELHVHMARNEELRQKLQRGAQELKRLQEAFVVAERAAFAREHAQSLAVNVEQLQLQIDRSHESRENLSSKNVQDPKKLADAKAETVQLRQEVNELEKQIARVNDHHHKVSLSYVSDANRLEKEIEAKIHQAEALETRLHEAENDRTWVKQQWEQSQLAIERKYEKIFKSKPPPSRFAKQEAGVDEAPDPG